MPTLTAEDKRSIAELVALRKPGYTMPGDFYASELVYRAEIEQIWRQGWLFVGHSCEIRNPGNYITFAVGDDSLIVIRDDDGQVNALWNVCRHRGTRICGESHGTVGRLVCPYHQWAYARDGALVSCRGMQDDVDKSELGLLHAHVREVAGLIYVTLSDDPPNFDEAAEAIGQIARPQGLDRAKVAKIVDYDVPANWKLVWENNRECYHCNVNHPQYIKANFDHFNADDLSERVQSRIDKAVARSQEKWSAAGLAVSHRRTGMTQFPDTERNCWFAANRTPLVDGYVSESMDGRQVAPLMGDYTDADVGTLRIRTLPNMWHHASCDHAVTTRVLPAGIHRTAGPRHLARRKECRRRPRLPARRHHAVLATHVGTGLDPVRARAKGREQFALCAGAVLDLQRVQRRRVRAVVPAAARHRMIPLRVGIHHV